MSEKVLQPFTFSKEDVVEVMNYEVDEEGKLVAHGKVMNVEGETMHEIIIYAGCVSMEVQKNENNEYVIFRSVEMDDPPIQKIEEAIGNFIL